jgi:hypothetical protein
MLRAILACLLATGLLAFAPVSAADETYTLKLYKSKKGDKTEYEKNESTKTNVLISAGGMDKNEETTSGKKEVFTEEILEKKDSERWPTKLTRTYTVAEVTEKDKTTKTVYAGETVLIEKKGDKYEFSVKGKALKENEAPELFQKFNGKKDDEPRNEDFLPEDPVKVGGSWKIPADKSERMFKTLSGEKMKVDAKKSSIGGKLLKVYKKDGAQFGILELTFTVFVTELDIGGQLTKTSAESKIVLKGTLDTCIDGTVEFEDGKMEMTLDVTAEIPNVGSITVKATTTGTDKSRASKK